MNSLFQELNKFLESSQRILLTGPQDPSVDIVSTAVSWSLFLAKQKKQVDLAFDGKISKLGFLPTKIKMEPELTNINKFKIILDITRTQVKQLSYDIKDKQLEIDIVPEGGLFAAKDVKTEQGDYKYDLVIVLGATNLEVLGKIFSEHRYFFYHVPIINIDRSVLNDNFGQLNIIEASATSLAEISYDFLEKELDKNIATCLLGGIVAATNSFQSPQVTPATLELASQLIIKGADRERVIETLYKTKDINTLKNWGKVLSRLKKEKNIITSFLKYDEADNLPQDFQEMIKELILSTPEAQVAIIFYQLELHQTEVWLYTTSNVNALEISKDLESSGHKQFVQFMVNQDLESAKILVIKKISDKLNIINKQ